MEKMEFGFGFSLKELIIFNTNEKFEKMFIDRTDENDPIKIKEPIYKLIQLSSFALFLNTNENLDLSECQIINPCIF